MKEQQNINQQSQNTGEAANAKSNNSADNKNVHADEAITNETAPHLKDELTIGKSHSWNESASDDGNAEQEELNKNVKKKIPVVEIKIKETNERPIK